MTYNLLNYDYSGGGRDVYLYTIIDSVRPDIFVAQEIISYGGASRVRDSIMTDRKSVV